MTFSGGGAAGARDGGAVANKGALYKRVPTTVAEDGREVLVCDDDGEEIRDSRDSRGIRDWSSGHDIKGAFFEAGWFQAITAAVILVNTVMIFHEMHHPESREKLWWPEQISLVFYAFELMCRLAFLRRRFLRGPPQIVVSNLLDLVVVLAGVVDQWLLPALPRMDAVRHGPVKSVFEGLRMLRLVRILKLLRLLLEADLEWTEEALFQSFIATIIIFNALLMGLETDVDWDGWYYIESVLLCVYVFELSVRLKRHGRSFFFNGDLVWNWLDFIIVASSVIDQWIVPLMMMLFDVQKSTGSIGRLMMLMRMLRLMRILRLVRLVRSVRPLFNLVMGVLAAMQGIGWVLVLTLVTLYAAGILGTRLVGHGDIFPDDVEIPEIVREPFATVPQSMFMLFRLMNGAQSSEEAMAIDTLMARVPSVKFGFIFFMVTYTWTLLSILTAVVSENMITSTQEQEEEDNITRREQERKTHIDELRQLFTALDNNNSGTVEEAEVRRYLADPEQAKQVGRICGVPPRDVPEVLKALSIDGQPVDISLFVEVLSDCSTTVTERSILMLQSRLASLERRSQAEFDVIRQSVQQIERRQEAWQLQQAAVLGRILEAVASTSSPIPAPALLPMTPPFVSERVGSAGSAESGNSSWPLVPSPSAAPLPGLCAESEWDFFAGLTQRGSVDNGNSSQSRPG